MNVYKTENIRNVILMGHGGAGKSTTAEAMAFSTGIISRMGNITDGNTISDFDKEEIKRKFSINSTVIPVEYDGIKINLLDTPGYFDFIGATEDALSVCDGAVIVVNAKSGVEVGTAKGWAFCEKFGVPRIMFVSGMDDANADYQKICVDLKANFGNKIAPFQIPFREGGAIAGYVDVIAQKAYKYKPNGTAEECAIPADLQDSAAEVRESIMENVAETSEELMEKYFGGEEFTDEEILNALHTAVTEGDIVPVFAGSAIKNFGTVTLMNAIKTYFPDPATSPTIRSGNDANTDEVYECKCDPAGPLAAYVFKTIIDPFIGKYSLVKVYSGVLKADDMLYNAESGQSEKIAKLYIMRGSKVEEVKELQPGDIGAIGKLDLAKTGDTLSRKEAPITLYKFVYSQPYTYKKYSAANKGEEDKISSSLAKLCAEDKTLRVVADEENKQALIYGIGDQQLDVVASKMKEKYKVEIILEKPAFPFRETLRKTAEVEGKHKKQSGGHGQYGHVKMIFEPSGDLETPYVFEEKIFGGSVPRNFFPAVEKGIQECVLRGPLANYPVVGVKATLIDGSYHPVDSNEMSFKMASTLAFKKGFMAANPVLLEPIASLKVTVPNDFTGDVMGDLNKRRGRVLGMNPEEPGKTCIEADIPMSELYGYNTDLRSMTGGYGDFSYEFARYEQAHADVQQKEVAARQTKDED
ncbi:MAG: elongation factor G [Parasporobacterium sp.]|nr:elongation factor G [Parasporobacterium sp.]